MTQILIFGDSITYGAWDVEGEWVQRLRKSLDERTLAEPNFYCLIYNLGVSGDTTKNILERFEFETRQRLGEKEETIILFDIGANDSLYIDNKNNISIEKFKKNIKNLINLAKKYSKKIIFIGLFPVDETKTIPIPWDDKKSYKNEYINNYNQAIKSICEENEIYFINNFDKLIKSEYKNLLEDGVHPNTEGHSRIFEIIKEFLSKNKII